ncbi:MAG: cupin domain-containing protein [Actinomycetia bacterium]|nr:cupin domain-containing protein [Actinomycetes bacterium]
MPGDSLFLGPGQGETFSIGPVQVRLLSTAQNTGDRSSVEEFTVPPAFEGPPVHAHERTDHSWYVVDGVATFVTADRTIDVVAGGFLFIPAGVAHAFANRSSQPMRLLEFTTPGGFGAYLRDLSAAVGEDAMDPVAVLEVMDRHDTYSVDL